MQDHGAVPARRDDRDHGPVDRAGRASSSGCRRSCSTTPSSPRQTNWFVYPLAHSVVTPDCYQGKVRGTHAPLRRATTSSPTSTRTASSPTRRSSPRSASSPASRTRSCGSSRGRPCTTAARRASPATQKRDLVETLERHGRVLISSEAPLPADLAPLEVKGPVEDIHHLLAYAQMIVGESATMSSEAAVLGVPAVMIATTGRGYTDDEERRYGLVRHFTDDQYDRAVDDRREARSPTRRASSASCARERLLDGQDRRHPVDGRLLRVARSERRGERADVRDRGHRRVR